MLAPDGLWSLQESTQRPACGAQAPASKRKRPDDCAYGADPTRQRTALAGMPEAARAALVSQLLTLYHRLGHEVEAGCGHCGHCAVCIWSSRCRRCEQCSECYEADALRGRRQRAMLKLIVHRIEALPEPSPAASSSEWLPVLGASDEWEAGWEAGQHAASTEQKKTVLWDRATRIIGCLDRPTILALLPEAFQEAAAAAAHCLC